MVKGVNSLKFLSDEMCGDINRWLRMLGYDSTIPQDHPKQDGSTPNDDEIIEICLSTHRILISKDYEIIKKLNQKTEKSLKFDKKFISRFGIEEESGKDSKTSTFPCILLRSTGITENLSEIHKKFNIQLSYGIDKARCPKCNSILQKIQNPEEFKEKIPPSVYKFHTQFWKCSNSECGQLFWKGTHIERILETLKRVQKKD